MIWACRSYWSVTRTQWCFLTYSFAMKMEPSTSKTTINPRQAIPTYTSKAATILVGMLIFPRANIADSNTTAPEIKILIPMVSISSVCSPLQKNLLTWTTEISCSEPRYIRVRSQGLRNPLGIHASSS